MEIGSPLQFALILGLCIVLAGCTSMSRFDSIQAVSPIGRTVELAGTEVYLTERPGPNDRAEPSTVVLIHGFGASSYSWRKVVGPIARSHRVIALDLPGFGYSARPEDPTLYTLTGRVATVSALLDSLGLVEPIHLVGHSYGGGIALRFASTAPNRVASLTLVDSTLPSHSRAPLRGLWRRKPLAYAILRTFGLSKFFVRTALETTFYYPHLVTDDLLQEYLIRLRIKGPASPYRSLPATVPLERLRVDLPAIRVPTLVVWGEQDRLIPVVAGRKAAAAIPGARFHAIDRCGHMPMEERPETFLAQLIPFLAQHDAQTRSAPEGR